MCCVYVVVWPYMCVVMSVYESVCVCVVVCMRDFNSIRCCVICVCVRAYGVRLDTCVCVCEGVCVARMHTHIQI